MAVHCLSCPRGIPSSLIRATPSPLPSFILQVVALRRSSCRAIERNVEIVHNLTRSPRVSSGGVAPGGGEIIRRRSQKNSCLYQAQFCENGVSQRAVHTKVVVYGRSGRSALYGDAETYVLMEPGEDEQFVTAEELQEKLKSWLQEWPGEEPPIDLSKFNSIDEAVQFLVNAVCELDLGGGQGSLQWYEVRLEQE